MSKKEKKEELEEVVKKGEVLEDITEKNATDMDETFVNRLKQDLEEQKNKTNEYMDHLQRTMADFDNYKKRIVKEKESLYSSILADLVADILPILDNLENALNSDKSESPFKSGIEIIYKQFKDILNKFKVEEIDGIKSTFNPELHEAVMHIEDNNFGKQEVVEVFRRGYKIGDKVIRHSMVKVAN